MGSASHLLLAPLGHRQMDRHLLILATSGVTVVTPQCIHTSFHRSELGPSWENTRLLMKFTPSRPSPSPPAVQAS